MKGLKPGRLGKQSEAAFMAQVVALARIYGWREYHTRDSRRSNEGFPDLVLVHRGRKLVIVAELKVGTNQPSAAQREWLQLLAAAGIPAYRWWPTDWDEIEQVLRGEIAA